MDGSELGDLTLLKIGLYTIAEASRLARIPQARLRRWVRGYAYHADEGRAVSAPLWPRQLLQVDGTIGLGFRDLMEARFAEQARRLFGSDHPFSSQRFRTDGRTIFAEIVASVGRKAAS